MALFQRLEKISKKEQKTECMKCFSEIDFVNKQLKVSLEFILNIQNEFVFT